MLDEDELEDELELEASDDEPDEEVLDAGVEDEDDARLSVR